MTECQTERIARLGNLDGAWYGASAFLMPVRFPSLEIVTLTAGYAMRTKCVACGQLLKPQPNAGALQFAVSAVILHVDRETFEVYHKDCAPADIPYLHVLAHKARETTQRRESAKSTQIQESFWNG